MKELLQQRFLPRDYTQNLYRQLLDYQQGNHSISDYTKEFLRLKARCNIQEDGDLQVARYIRGLNSEIREQIGVQIFMSLMDAREMAARAEARLTPQPPRLTYPRRNYRDTPLPQATEAAPP
ncbi:unnamed protein product [Linum trigynum]|uniref:Retrotransposon gag domain-containing protein n=1 Tax=Linum trigynum TaxID=586398 RepID=A0AAV2GLM3_9ROSI